MCDVADCKGGGEGVCVCDVMRTILSPLMNSLSKCLCN